MNAPRLKALSREAIPRALERVQRYRLLNQPAVAESICRDILAADPDHRQAQVERILALTDQFEGHTGPGIHQVMELVGRLQDPYDRAYYAGIVCERQAKARLKREYPGARFDAYDLILKAMEHYDQADGMRAAGNEDARLHWNHCLRLIQDQSLQARPAADEREAAGD